MSKTKTIEKIGPGVCSLTLVDGGSGATDFAASCKDLKVSFDYSTPEPSKYLDGSTRSEPGTLKAKVSGKIQQAFGTDSLLVWCYTNRGKTANIEIVPNKEGKVKVTGVVMITPVDIGGEVGKSADSDFTFDFIGDPEIDTSYTA